MTDAREGVFQLSDVRADQYGIRTKISVAGQSIKFEIVLEGRISLDRPGKGDEILGVATLTQLDRAVSKLLANSDRWADGSYRLTPYDETFARKVDLIEKIMREDKEVLRALAK